MQTDPDQVFSLSSLCKYIWKFDLLFYHVTKNVWFFTFEAIQRVCNSVSLIKTIIFTVNFTKKDLIWQKPGLNGSKWNYYSFHYVLYSKTLEGLINCESGAIF